MVSSKLIRLSFLVLLPVLAIGQTPRPTSFDVVIKNGTVYDGTGGAPRRS